MAGLLDARVVVHNDRCRGIILHLGREEIPRTGIRPQARPPKTALPQQTMLAPYVAVNSGHAADKRATSLRRVVSRVHKGRRNAEGWHLIDGGKARSR